MASTQITPDRDTVISQIEIAAPPERVFRALVDRDQALQWGNSEAFEITHWEMDARLGGKWRFTSRPRKDAAQIFDHHGEILEIDPPRVLAYSWHANWHSSPTHPTTVRWELTPTKTGTRLQVTHSNLAQLSGVCEGYSQGWPGLLQQIKNFAEKTKEEPAK